MISRKHRFHGHNSLRNTYQKGKTVRAGQLALKYVVDERRTDYRAAVVVSRKVHKSAVVRNRIRRRIYECLRLAAPDMVVQADMVFTVFEASIAHSAPTELSSQVRRLLQNAHIIK
jgi:ribonuclease P protein component